MNKIDIIKSVQAGKNICTEENIFVPMTKEQAAARRVNFVRGLKMNQFKLESVARYGSM